MHSAFEQLQGFFTDHNCDWEKGLKFVEPCYHVIEPETILARHHQLAVLLQPDFAPLARCPKGLDHQLYLKMRSQERLDNLLRD